MTKSGVEGVLLFVTPAEISSFTSYRCPTPQVFSAAPQHRVREQHLRSGETDRQEQGDSVLDTLRRQLEASTERNDRYVCEEVSAPVTLELRRAIGYDQSRTACEVGRELVSVLLFRAERADARPWMHPRCFDHRCAACCQGQDV